MYTSIRQSPEWLNYGPSLLERQRYEVWANAIQLQLHFPNNTYVSYAKSRSSHRQSLCDTITHDLFSTDVL